MLNPYDPRDIPETAVGSPLPSLPSQYFEDVSMYPAWNQKKTEACTAFAHARIIQRFHFLETGKVEDISRRFLYGMAKKLDNYPGRGTYPRVVAKVSSSLGSPTTKYLDDNVDLSDEEYRKITLSPQAIIDASSRKTAGYVFIAPDAEKIAENIIKYGFIEVTLNRGNWSRSPVKSGDGKYKHRLVLYGYTYERGEYLFYFIDSDGQSTHKFFKYSEHAGKIRDIMAYTDVPVKIIEEAKKAFALRYFKPSEFSHFDKMNKDLLLIADEARHRCGFPWVITSSYRTPADNKRVGGTKGSSHLKGLAIDVALPSGLLYKLVKGMRTIHMGSYVFDFVKKIIFLSMFDTDKQAVAVRHLIDLGITRIEVAKNHIHIDVDKTKPSPTIYTD